MNSYKEIFYALPFPCLLLARKERSFVVIETNKTYLEISGRKKEEVEGKPYLQVVASDGDDPHIQLRRSSLLKVVETGEPDKIDCLRRDFICNEKKVLQENYWQVENIPIPGDNGKIDLILNIARNTTSQILGEKEKQKIEKELSGTRDQQQHFIDRNPDGLYSLDTNGYFLSLNHGLERIAETPREELLKMNFDPFCAPYHYDYILENFNRTLAGENRQFEADFITGKGRKVVLNISLNPMVVAGKITGAYGIAKDITGLQDAREALAVKEKKFKALVQKGTDLNAILDSSGNYLYVSENTYTILGIKADDLIGKCAFDLIHSQDQERVKKDFEALSTRSQVQIEPFRFRNNHNEWQWIESTATNLEEDPAVKGIVVNSRVVTELVHRSRELKQLYERYHLAATATEDLIYDWDLENDKIVRFFKGMDNPFGYSHSEIEQQSFWQSKIHPEDIDCLKNTLTSALLTTEQTHLRTRYRFKRANGSYAHIIDRAHILRDEAGTAVRMIGATSDISEITEKENALRAANKRFSYALMATQEMMWDWDLEKNAIKRSESFQRNFNFPFPNSNSSPQKYWFNLILPKERDRVVQSLHEAIENKAVKKWKEEYCVRKENGEEVFVVDRAYILRNKSGKALRLIGAVLDVTESRNLLKKIKHQNKVLRDVAWEQAHIVRAPLARLKGLIGLLELESYGEWNREEIVDLINNSANELDTIIENIIRKTEEI